MTSSALTRRRMPHLATNRPVGMPTSSRVFGTEARDLVGSAALYRYPIATSGHESHFPTNQNAGWFSVSRGGGVDTGFETPVHETSPGEIRICAPDIVLCDWGGSEILVEAKTAGSYIRPEAMFWRDVSSASRTNPSGTETRVAWIAVSDAATWDDAPDVASVKDIHSQSVARTVAAITRAARGEHFESGYESQFRRQLAHLYRSFGSSVIDALCERMTTAGVDADVLAQGLRFLATVDDPRSLDRRLECIASFLQDPSAVVRDSAGTALEVLGDRRAVTYLREAASREDHVVLKYELLEIAAELETG